MSAVGGLGWDNKWSTGPQGPDRNSGLIRLDIFWGQGNREV